MNINIDDLTTYSPSQIAVFMDCPQKWHYNYKQGLRKAGSTRALDNGTYAHELAHVYYHALQETDFKPGSRFLTDMMKSRIRSDINNITPDNIETVNVVSKMILDFVEKVSPSIDGNIREIIGVEYEFKAPMRTPNGHDIALHGIIDLLYIDKAGRLRVRDHKTSSQLNAWNQRKLSLDLQQMLYAVAISQLIRPVYDVEINFMNTHIYKEQRPLSDRFKLIPWSFSPTAMEKATGRILNIIDAMLDTPTYRKYNKECASCPYYDLCELELRGLDTTRVELSSYVKRDVKDEPGPKIADFFQVDSTKHTDPNEDTGTFTFDLR